MNFFDFCKAVAALVNDPARAASIARGSSSMYHFWDEAWTPQQVADHLNGGHLL